LWNMKIEENIPLAPLTTFKIGGKARYFCRVSEPKELSEAFAFAKKNKLKVYVLGGGSNILISDRGLKGLVIRMDILGIEISETDSKRIELIAGAGESWDYVVSLSVEKNLGGLENLSGIPGMVGGAPVQNIGAYGIEVENTVAWVEVFDPKIMDLKILKKSDCKFGYRDSIFKKPTGKDFVITRVAFSLSKTGRPNIEYKDLADYFGKRKNSKPTVAEVREAVLGIRQSKFKESLKYGTAGSFFKNPVISEKKFKELKKILSELPGFSSGAGKIKVSLAWIIDKVCGLKGFRLGNVGISPDQPLVVINYGGVKSEEIIALANEVRDVVKEKTGIEIEPEVRLLY
jgi:UDP-N-acetylmuramate dehydrogenase